MTNNSYLLILIFVTFALNACNSDCHDKGNCDPEYYRWDLGEAKSYLWADTGSYWIYKNSKTGELDTQTCVGSKTYWVNVKGNTNYAKHITIDYEVLNRRLYSTYNKWYYNDKTTDANPNVAVLENNIIVDRTVGGQGINIPFSYPFVKGLGGNTGSSSTTCTNTDTSIIVNGKTYDHVVVFDVNMDEIWEEKLGCIRPNTKYFWVKNIGLIKKTMNRCNYSWDLIDYKIIP